MYTSNYDELFGNQNNISDNNSDNFSDADLTNSSNPSVITTDEFGDEEIEMLWDDEEVTADSDDQFNLNNTQIIETNAVKEASSNDVYAINTINPVGTNEYTNYDPNQDNVNIDQYLLDNKKANKLCIFAILSIVIYLIPIVGLDIFKAKPGFGQDFFLVFSSFANIFPVISICLLVYIKTKYPFNKFVNVLIYIYAAVFIVFVIIYFIYIFGCFGDIPSCFKM